MPQQMEAGFFFEKWRQTWLVKPNKNADMK
jgi:hypothetical protein